MPEGDTIFRAAARLRPCEGLRILAADARSDGLDAPSLAGRTLQSVEARGKHLLLHLDDGRAIHSHLGMFGAWHVYGRQESWRKPQRLAHLVLRMDAAVLVCFNPKLLELLTAAQIPRHRWLARLGPDLLANRFDQAEALRRLRIHSPTPIGEAVMNQSVVCGIGNVYKSEILFLTAIHPLTPVGELTDEQLSGILGLARRLMLRNLDGHARRTRFRGDAQRLWVYDRAAAACRRCATPIAVTRQGDLGRTTFYCPNCQGLRCGGERVRGTCEEGERE